MNGFTQRLNIHQGEIYFGSQYEYVGTLLGSCISIVVWHPVKKVGGLCHYLLPAPKEGVVPSGNERYKYARWALDQMTRSMKRIAPLETFQVSMFGGGDMKTSPTSASIGQANIKAALEWLEHENIALHKRDIGGSTPRVISLDARTGEVTVKHTKPMTKCQKLSAPAKKKFTMQPYRHQEAL